MDYTDWQEGQTHSINRNIVECKVTIQELRVYLAEVLIETLWNVKMYETVRSQLPPELVLIETLWNVKKIKFVNSDGSQMY